MKENSSAEKKCPLCEKEKRIEDPVCIDCHSDVYVPEAGKALAYKGRVVSEEEWLSNKLVQLLQSLQNDLEKIRTQYVALQEKLCVEARDAIVDIVKTSGKRVVREVFVSAVEEKKKALWQEQGGNKLHWQLKISGAKIASLQQALEELSKKIVAPHAEKTTGEEIGPSKVEPETNGAPNGSLEAGETVGNNKEVTEKV